MKLSTQNGLSDNKVNIARLDKNGLMWVGTDNGLNCFDGYTIKKFFREDHPAMGSNTINNILCDPKNRLWISWPEGGACMLDENRNFHAVVADNDGKHETYFYPIQTQASGLLLKSGSRLYAMADSINPVFKKLKWSEDPALSHPFTKWSRWDSSRVAFIGAGRFVLFDALQLKVETDIQVPGIAGAERISATEMLVTLVDGGPLIRYNIPEKKVVRQYSLLKDQFGTVINNSLRGIGSLGDGRVVITSGYAGIYIFDYVNETLLRYSHDPLNDRSVSADNTVYAITDTTGFIFVTTNTAGLNYCNLRQSLAGYQPLFMDTHTNQLFDGFVTALAEDRHGAVWLGTQSRLIRWNRSSNTSAFFNFGSSGHFQLSGNENVRSLYFDEAGKLWVGTSRFGIILLDNQMRPVKQISTAITGSRSTIPVNSSVQTIVHSGNKDIWVATSSGLRVFNKAGIELDMEAHPLVKSVMGKFCFVVWFRNKNEIWAGTTDGAYRYRITDNVLDSFTVSNYKMPDNRAICFAGDYGGDVYIGTGNGLFRLAADGRSKVYQKGNGLQHGFCESIISDREGNLWIANSSCLLKFIPGQEIFEVYDERFGLTNAGFKEQAVLMTMDGELIYGTNRGVNYFTPGNLHLAHAPLNVMVTSGNAGNVNLYSTLPGTHDLPYHSNTLLFTFSAIDLYSSNNIRYQYRLAGADSTWATAVNLRQVIYSRLRPGAYTFEVRASRYGGEWVYASNPVVIVIQPPWWNTPLFIFVASIVFVLIIAFVIYRRGNYLKRQREALETEQAINWFATSLNDKNTVDDILWDVSRNCISRLHFEDCVIYLTDNERKVLMQKAAWGPKTTNENKILNPIEIPFGSGICGTVAETGVAEIVNDTSKDHRYIVDDAMRFSEICVPIISDGKVLGVIDSENSRKNFFNHRHLSILSTIASLCSVKIVRAITEMEKNRAQQELQHLEQRAVATEMLALRAQMNPHFLFNSLNSINNFILKSDTENASEYLTRFSKLMRMILDNSRQDWVLLENELKALQLYLELESVRLKNAFSYRLVVDESVNPVSEQVPPMLVQPYVENAIWHGLLNRQEPGGMLLLHIAANDGGLRICVEDNGVGRKEAAQLKSKFQSHKKSHGMQITAERIDIINRTYPVHISVHITDVLDHDAIAGTCVVLDIKRM